MLGWWLVGCGAGEGSATLPTPPAPEPTEPPPPFAVDLSTAEVAVPCVETVALRLRNQDDVDHLVSEVSVRTRSDQVLLDDRGFDGAVVHPDGVFELPLRVTAEVAETAAIDVDLAWEDGGGLSAQVVLEIGWAELRTETVVVAPPLVDVMVLVDASVQSPDTRQAELREGLPDFVDGLAGTDWRISLVRGDDRCVAGPFDARADVLDVLGRTAFDAEPGEDSEALLRMASFALAENAPGECNEDFLRDGSQLQLVVVSDEPEQSGRPWTWWRDDWAHYADTTVVSGVLDLGRCGSGAAGYADAARGTGGITLDVCGGFGSELGRLADAVVPLPPRFPLPGDVVAASVEARIGGRAVGASWDADAGEVVLDDLVAPGTSVTLAWSPPAECR